MPKRVRIAVVFVAGLLVPQVAAAECAWVLWLRAAAADGGGAIVGPWTPWIPHGATNGPDGCDSLVPNGAQAHLRAIEATRVSLAKGQVAKLAWQCLPDTVDPRGPKAS
jgi:hypothetical protein